MLPTYSSAPDLLVPRDQIIDTSELFWLKGQRKLSLRFLASALLQLDIQSGNHDSIEDARTALLLYEKFLVLKEASQVEQTLKHLYDLGSKTNWLPPTAMKQQQQQQ
jgi:PAB-dependent poly(A)-specific ribonuclease subunit 2